MATKKPAKADSATAELTATAEQSADPASETVEAEAVATGPVALKVTADGHGLIFKGQLIGGIEQTFAEGDTFAAHPDTAADLIGKGLAEPA